MQPQPRFTGPLVHQTLLACALLACLPAQAKTGDTLQPYLYYNFTQDNNLFRTAVNKQSETYSQLGAGLLLDWKQNRQEVVGRISANRTTFSKSDILNYSGYDLMGQWNWQLGNHLSGQLGYTDSRSLSSFVDYTGTLSQNTLNRSNTYFNGSYLFHPRWRINLVLGSETLDYSAASLQVSNRTVDHLEIGTDYLTPKGSRLGIYAGRWNGDYPNRQVFFFSTVDNSYKQEEMGLRANWVLDGKLQLNGRLGQTQRKHDEVPQRNFSGLTGRLDATWQTTGKTVIKGALYRDIGAVDDIYANYSVNDGVRLSPTWLISQKVNLNAELYSENRHFEGDPFSFGLQRKDKVNGYSLSLNYQPKDWTTLGLSYQTQTRNSNLANDFSDQTLNLSVQLIF